MAPSPSSASEAEPLVLLSERLGPVTEEERRIAGAVRGAPLWTFEEIAANAAGATAVILGAVEPFDARAISALPRCHAIVRRGVGVDNVDLDAATEHGIVVAHVVDASVEEVSDHALALLLGLERRTGALDALVRDGGWRRDPAAIAAVRAPIRRLRELVLGIVGFGRIGRALARKAKGLYGDVVVADPYTDADAAAALGVRIVALDDLLAGADHVSLHAALGTGSRQLIDAAALARMRPGAVLVNTARGGLVDEDALVDALRAGRLAAAGLDVTVREPVPAGSPLLGADGLGVEGLVLTGHSAVASTTAQAELARRSVDAVVDLLAGRRPAAVANPAVLGSPRLRAAALAG